MNSFRPSIPLLMGFCAAGIGAASGELVDPTPLRWGSNLSDYVSHEEQPAATARRMHERFEVAKRLRLVEETDYLAEDEVIYLQPVEASARAERKLASHDERQPLVDTSPSMTEDPSPAPGQEQTELHLAGRLEAEAERRIAEGVAAPKIVHFPAPGWNGG